MRINKILSAAMAAVSITAALSGCKPAEQNNDRGLDKNSPVTITVWHYYNGVQQTSFDDMVKEFNDTVGMEKGIIVEASSKNSINELASSVTAALKNEPGADEAPDIFGCYADNAYIVDKMGMVADISQYFTEEELAEYVDGYINEGRFDEGTLKIFPTAKSTEIMMINKTDWDKFAAAEGVSYDDLKTWESLVTVSEKYYNYTDALTPDVPNDGKSFFGRDSVENYMLIGAKQLGAPLVSENGEPEQSIDKAAVKRLWENYYVPFVKGYFAMEGRFRSDDAKTGKVIALVCSTTGAAYYPNEVTLNDDTVYPIENVVLPIPNFEGTEAYAVQQGAGMSVIKSDEKTEYACTVFLKWFTEAERNLGFAVDSGYLPVKKAANSAAELDKISADTINATMRGTLSTAMEEVNSYKLYAAKPFEKSAAFRSALKNYMESTTKDDYAAAAARIADGEARDTVLAEYTSDAAFDKWFEGFNSALAV